MPAIEIPWDRLREPSHEWNLGASTFSPGQTALGAFPFGRMDGGGVWTANIKDIKLRSRNDVLLWRAIRNACQGGVNPIIVPRRETLTPPFPTIGGRRITGHSQITHSDGSLFSDGSGYFQPVISAYAVGSAALRATTMTIHFLADTADPLGGGEFFSINNAVQGWRMHEIATAFLNHDGDSVVTFEPPLREAVTDATQIEFDRPRCVMRLRASNAMDLELRPYPFGQATMSFVEYFYPEA